MRGHRRITKPWPDITRRPPSAWKAMHRGRRTRREFMPHRSPAVVLCKASQCTASTRREIYVRLRLKIANSRNSIESSRAPRVETRDSARRILVTYDRLDPWGEELCSMVHVSAHVDRDQCLLCEILCVDRSPADAPQLIAEVPSEPRARRLRSGAWAKTSRPASMRARSSASPARRAIRHRADD